MNPLNLMNLALLIALSALFVGALTLAGLPAAVLIGSMGAAIVLSVRGRGVKVPKPALAFAQGFLGAMIARSFTPQLFSALAGHAVACLLVIIAGLAIALAIGVMLSRLKVLPGTTALWGSFPGAASMMVVMSEAFGADVRLVAFMQYLRVLVVACVASGVARLSGAHGSAPRASIFAPVDWLSFAFTTGLVVLCVLAATRFKFRGGPMLLSMVLGCALQNSVGLHLELPRLLLMVTYALIGWMVGMRFTPEIVRHVRRAFPRVLGAIVLLVVLCALLGVAVSQLLGLDLLSGYFATSPGGADSIAILANGTGVDLSLVMAIQLGRTIVVLLIGPLLARWLAPLATAPEPS